MGRGPDAAEAQVVLADAALFPLLGVTPVLGRFFDPTEDEIGANPTVVLSREYWQREFGSDPDVLGRAIDVGAGSHEVIGVAPSGLTGAELSPVDLWVPMRMFEALNNGDGWVENRGWYWLRAVARLQPGATVELAAEQATAAHRNGRREMIDEGRYDAEAEVLVAPIIAAQGPEPSREAEVARWLGGVSLIVLLIACFNVANLLLARSIRVQRETVVRRALGAGRGRLAIELVGESVVLAGLGGVAAVALAYVIEGPAHAVLLPGVATGTSAVDGRLVLFTLGIALLAGLVSGGLPALRATGARTVATLQSGGARVVAGRTRTQALLLVAQAALSVVLLVGAGLFVRSVRGAGDLDLGFDAGRVAVVRLEWNETLDSDVRAEIYGSALERLRRLPGVSEAALTYTVPFYSAISLGQPRVPGLDSVPRHHNGGPYVNKVGSGYFEAMGLEIVRGRPFEPRDDGEGAPPVAVVSESMANAIWPAGDALGACMIIEPDEEGSSCTEVVGVVENHRRQDLVEDDPHFMYFLNQHHPQMIGPPQSLMVRTDDDPAGLLAELRSAAAVSPQIRFVATTPLREFIDPHLRSWTLGASAFSAFGVLALLVAAWGLYSVLAFDVALRRREMGIRSALGAPRPRLVHMVLQRAVVLVGLGIAAGLIFARLTARFVEPLLFRVSATDVAVYLAVAATLVAVGATAGFLPAWRASRVDPTEALRSD